MRYDPKILQFANARLLGCRWPAELDAALELNPEQRPLAEEAAFLIQYSDLDGIVGIPLIAAAN